MKTSRNIDIKFLLLSIFATFLILNLVSAVQLSTGTILNANTSDTNITIDSPNITVSSFEVNNSYIILTDMSYINGDLILNMSGDLNYSIPSSNINSSQFPRITTTQSGGDTLLLSSSLPTFNSSMTIPRADLYVCSKITSVKVNTVETAYSCSDATEKITLTTSIVNGTDSTTVSVSYDKSASQGGGGGGGSTGVCTLQKLDSILSDWKSFRVDLNTVDYYITRWKNYESC